MRFSPATGFRWSTSRATRRAQGARRALCLIAALVSLTTLPLARAADDPIQPAERLLFMADHLHGVAVPGDLVYDFEKAGSLTPAGRSAVHVKLSRHGKDVGAEVSDAPDQKPLAVEGGLKGNPVILYFLNKDINEMRDLTGGQPRYFQKQIRMALAQGPDVTPTTIELDGKRVLARQVVIQPYLNDANHQRFEKLTAKRYTFVLSEHVPGQVLLLKSEVPGKEQDFAHPLQTNTLRFQERR